MCERTNSGKIDRCLQPLVSGLVEYQVDLLASCCGHGRYPMTLVVRNRDGTILDLVSGIRIPRKRNFYRRDRRGFYYIPEISRARR